MRINLWNVENCLIESLRGYTNPYFSAISSSAFQFGIMQLGTFMIRPFGAINKHSREWVDESSESMLRSIPTSVNVTLKYFLENPIPDKFAKDKIVHSGVPAQLLVHL